MNCCQKVFSIIPNNVTERSLKGQNKRDIIKKYSKSDKANPFRATKFLLNILYVVPKFMIDS